MKKIFQNHLKLQIKINLFSFLVKNSLFMSYNQTSLSLRKVLIEEDLLNDWRRCKKNLYSGNLWNFWGRNFKETDLKSIHKHDWGFFLPIFYSHTSIKIQRLIMKGQSLGEEFLICISNLFFNFQQKFPSDFHFSLEFWFPN